MDDLGNRFGTVEQRDANHTYAVDSLTNRYTAIDAAPITHDLAGNLIRDRQDYRYEYDYENRIARIYKLSGETQITVASFDYDALGHRVRKIDAIAGQTTLYYHDPEWRVLAEYDGSGTLQRTFVWGNYIDEAVRMRAGESDYYYLHDHLYSPAVLIGYESGQWRPVERYEYDAYGTARVINRGPDNAWFTADDVVTGSPSINTTLFTGRTLDALDSANLKISYYRHRYTDPFTGRFLQQDPIGILVESKQNTFDPISQYFGNLSLYQYCKNSPIVIYDSYGTCDCTFDSYETYPPKRAKIGAGETQISRWKVKPELIKCKSKCYKVDITKCETLVTYWYLEYPEYNPLFSNIDDFGNTVEEHELVHVNKVRIWWWRMDHEIQQLTLAQCYPKDVAKSCRDAIAAYAKAYEQVAWSQSVMFDCLAYGIKNNDEKLCVQAGKESEKASMLINKAKQLRKICLSKKASSSASAE